MTLYALSREVPDKILKGKKLTTMWKIMAGMSMGRETPNFGSHCLTDSKELAHGYIISENGWNLHTYDLIERKK